MGLGPGRAIRHCGRFSYSLLSVGELGFFRVFAGLAPSSPCTTPVASCRWARLQSAPGRPSFGGVHREAQKSEENDLPVKMTRARRCRRPSQASMPSGCCTMRASAWAGGCFFLLFRSLLLLLLGGCLGAFKGHVFLLTCCF